MLAAIAAANLAVQRWGYSALPFTAFALVPFEMLARDILHERWRDAGREWVGMLGLILAGGLVTVAINAEAVRIAAASVTAFSVSLSVNAAVFHRLFCQGRVVRMNASNAAAAVLDSLIFPVVAFGAISAPLAAGQAGAKFFGGVLFTALFIAYRQRAGQP